MSQTPQSSAPRKFTFDTEFDGPRPANSSSYKRLFSAEEVEELTQRAKAEGMATAMNRIEAQTARALSEIAEAAKTALPTLAAAAHEHRAGSAELALACARQIADAACDRFPEAPLQAALAARLLGQGLGLRGRKEAFVGAGGHGVAVEHRLEIELAVRWLR